MPTLETGLWIFMTVAASAFTFFAFRSLGKISGFFHITAMALWMGLAIMHAGGYEVSATETNLIYNETGILIFNETNSKVAIPGGETASWIAFLFMGFAILNIFVFLRGMLQV